TDLAQSLQVFRLDGVHTAFTLYRLKQYRNDTAVGLGNALYRFKVIEGRAYKTGQQGLKAGLNLTIACGRQGCHGAAVKGAFHDNNGGSLDTALVAIHAG